MGTVTLAANAVLFQMKDIMSYLVDGMLMARRFFQGGLWGRRVKNYSADVEDDL